MKGKPRSMRQAQAILAAQMRQQGRTWAEIGAAFQAAYRVNPRVALRQAHGWSQPQAAERWTARWPDDPKTFKNFSYWEQWPGQTGHAPSLDTLDRLAQLYQCSVTDLLADCRDYGVRRRVAAPPAGTRAGSLPRLPGRPAPALEARRCPRAEQPEPAARRASPRRRPDRAAGRARDDQAGEHHRLAQAGGRPADDVPDLRLRRRTLLLDASSALAVVAAAPMLEVPRIVSGRRASAGAPPTRRSSTTPVR